MLYRAKQFLAVCLLAMLVVRPVFAAECGPAGPMIAALKANYGEVQVFEALLEAPGESPTPIIFFASAKTRTWTMVANPSPDVLCLIFKGTDFDFATLPKHSEPSL